MPSCFSRFISLFSSHILRGASRGVSSPFRVSPFALILCFCFGVMPPNPSARCSKMHILHHSIRKSFLLRRNGTWAAGRYTPFLLVEFSCSLRPCIRRETADLWSCPPLTQQKLFRDMFWGSVRNCVSRPFFGWYAG